MLWVVGGWGGFSCKSSFPAFSPELEPLRVLNGSVEIIDPPLDFHSFPRCFLKKILLGD